MRAVCIVLAVIGGCALAVAVAIELATGDPVGAGWVLVGPGPFYAVGLVLAFRGPGQRVGAWLLATGATFLLSVCLGDAVLPLVAGSPAAGRLRPGDGAGRGGFGPGTARRGAARRA